jgi:hypothetical protein
MFRIERTRLLEEIWSKSQENSVLITGSPGIGKSWLVAQLVKTCKKQGRSSLSLIAEDYPVSSLEELHLALRFKTDVISFLRSLPGAPVLIIDGLDSLRSDPSQRTFRELIRRLTREVPKCSIIASIRTFDLRQSQEFQKLFFSSETFKAKPFLEVPVPVLSDEELSAVVSQVSALRSLLQNATGEFRQLLRNPFNLRLASDLSEAGTSSDELSGFHSQVQLLTKYWNWRIEAPGDRHDRQAFLRMVAKAMVDQKSLSVAGADVYQPGLGNVFDRLQSDEVLRRSVTGRVSFAHNILFDYGVARLLLDETTVTQFVQDDPSRTIFFRPSLAYFFYYLWLLNRELFWKVSFSFFESATLPERARVIPAVTIYEASRRPEDLDPILPCSTEAQIRAVVFTLRAVQTLGGLQTSARQLWLMVLGKLANNLKVDFINEYAGLLINADETKTSGESLPVFTMSAILLLWIWERGRELDRERAISLADFGAGRVLPLVLKNYAARPDFARQIVLSVLGRYGSEIAGAHEAFRLAHEIRSIIENDPATAAEVYKKTFGYKEESEEKTQLGGAAFSVTSTRKQDYSTALYGLQAAFLTFLAAAPEEATIAAIESVNGEIPREHPLKTHDEDGNPAEFSFHWEDRELRYRSDWSEIWDSGSHDDLSLNLLNSVLMYVTDALTKNDSDASAAQIVKSIIDRVSLAVVWKRLFQVAEAHIRVWYPILKPFLLQPELISAPETTIAAGQILKTAYAQNLVSPSDGLALEKAIVKIPNSRVIVRYEKPESIRNRLLMCIPRHQIRSEEGAVLADELLKAEENVRENRPYHSMTFSQKPFGTDDWLREQGVDTAKEENVTILAALEPIQSFESKYLNGVPPVKESVEMEPLLERVESLVNDPGLNEKVSQTARGVLCAAAEVILKNPELQVQDSVFIRCRNIVLRGAKDPWPPVNPKETFDMPGWGGSLPRIESAHGLAHFLWNWGLDTEVIKALRELSQDGVAAVRFQVANGLLGFWKYKAYDEFWTLIEAMIAKEKTPGVMEALVAVLGRISGQEPEHVARILTQMFERGTPPTDRYELTRALLQVTVGLFMFRNTQQANQLLEGFETDPIRFHKEIAEEIVAVSPYLGSSNKAEADAGRKGRELLIRILTNVYKKLDELTNDQSGRDKTEDFKTLLTIIDEVAIRIFFALDASPYRSGGERALDDESRRSIYFEVQPVIELLTVRRTVTGVHYLVPSTALHLMQTLNAVLAYDPANVVQYAAAVCEAGSKLNFHFDSEAIGEMVKLVEHVLADHREILKEPAVADALGDMLDKFVSVWPQAMGLTFRLDQAIR